MSIRDEVEKILEATSYDVPKAARRVYRPGNESMILYVLELGLNTFTRKQRAETRRRLHNTVINPKPVFVRGSVTGSIKPSPRQQARIDREARNLFTTYPIDANLMLGDATREQLIAAAQGERASTKGHLRKATWYEAMANQMKPGQIVKARWTGPEAAQLLRDEIWRTTESKDVTFAA
jgi:hypothetical protein